MNDTKDRGVLGSGLTVQFAGDDTIEFHGQKFTPDLAKGYFQFTMSHAFPSLLVYGTGLVAPVIAKSFGSLIHQNVNWEHLVAEYYREEGKPNNVDDRIIGSIVAVHFPDPGQDGYRFVYGASDQPAISGVASFFKRARGMKNLLGEHMTGRHEHTVSLEVEYPFSEGGFAIAMKRDKPVITAEFTPQQMLASGWEYIPFTKASDDLKSTFSRKRNRVISYYKGRNTAYLMGGLDGQVLYAGMGVVRHGAEPTARINRMTASANLVSPFQNFAELLKEIISCQQTKRLP